MPTPINVLADATLPGLSKLFMPPFVLSRYKNQSQIPSLLPNQDVLLCRSTLRVDHELLASSSIQCVGTASSGTDHIDSTYLKQKHIQLFDAKGSNARSVADYTVATLAALHHISKQPVGKLAGIVGVGEVGSRVLERMQAAGFDIICFDPFKSQQNNHGHYGALADLTACDVLFIHANLHESAQWPSKNLLNANFLAKLKSGVVIINAARGGIIDEKALLATKQHITYCTDVYCAEPAIDPRIIDYATVCTPHIAGHSVEAKQAAVIQVSQQLHHHFGVMMPTLTTTRGLTAGSGDLLGTMNLAGKSQDVGNWQDVVLSIYNPMLDTQILKRALDKKAAFLTQRQAHLYRHDFNCYEILGLNQQTALLFGK